MFPDILSSRFDTKMVIRQELHSVVKIDRIFLIKLLWNQNFLFLAKTSCSKINQVSKIHSLKNAHQTDGQIIRRVNGLTERLTDEWID